MTWKETGQKGVFSRPIGECEEYIKLVGEMGPQPDRENWAVNSTATVIPVGSLASSDLAAHFRRAWGHMRFQHPSLASEVTPDNKSLIYTVPADGTVLDAWVSQTFSVANEAQSSADVFSSFKTSPYAKLVYIPRSSELLIHSVHWRIDGIGSMLLLDALLTIAAKPSPLADPASLAWGTEVVRLVPTIEDAASVPVEPTPEIKERAAAIVGTFALTVGAVGIPYLGDASTQPAGTRSVAIKLSPATTEKVLAACKARGVTVTSAVHASVAGANYALADEAVRDRHYASTIRFTLRPHLREPYSTPVSASGLYTTGWMHRVEAQSSWAERLQSYQNEYRKGITRDFLDAHREYALQVVAALRSLPKPAAGDPPPPSYVDISNIGIVEKFVNRDYGTPEAGFQVKAVSLGVELLSPPCCIYVWTFRDQLNLSATYNEAYHSADQMSRFVDTVKSLLLEGLGVEG